MRKCEVEEVRYIYRRGLCSECRGWEEETGFKQMPRSKRLAEYNRIGISRVKKAGNLSCTAREEQEVSLSSPPSRFTRYSTRGLYQSGGKRIHLIKITSSPPTNSPTVNYFLGIPLSVPSSAQSLLSFLWLHISRFELQRAGKYGHSLCL
jgi:hypothetical protein